MGYPWEMVEWRWHGDRRYLHIDTAWLFLMADILITLVWCGFQVQELWTNNLSSPFETYLLLVIDDIPWNIDLNRDICSTSQKHCWWVYRRYRYDTKQQTSPVATNWLDWECQYFFYKERYITCVGSRLISILMSKRNIFFRVHYIFGKETQCRKHGVTNGPRFGPFGRQNQARQRKDG